MKSKKKARLIVGLIIALLSLGLLGLFLFPVERTREISIGILIALFGSAVAMIIEYFSGNDDQENRFVENLSKAVDDLGPKVDEHFYLLDSYTNLDETIAEIIKKRIRSSEHLKVTIILLDPRSPLVDLRANCLHLTPKDMRHKIATCLKSFLRHRSDLESEAERERVEIYAYDGILGIAAMRFDDTIIYSHYLRNKPTENSTWSYVREEHDKRMFHEIAAHFKAIIKCQQATEVTSENSVNSWLDQANKSDAK